MGYHQYCSLCRGVLTLKKSIDLEELILNAKKDLDDDPLNEYDRNMLNVATTLRKKLSRVDRSRCSRKYRS